MLKVQFMFRENQTVGCELRAEETAAGHFKEITDRLKTQLKGNCTESWKTHFLTKQCSAHPDVEESQGQLLLYQGKSKDQQTVFRDQEQSPQWQEQAHSGKFYSIFSELQLKSTQIQRGKDQTAGETGRILQRLILLKHELSPPFRDDSLRSHCKVLKDLLWSNALLAVKGS